MRPAWALGLLLLFSSVECAVAETLNFEVCGQSSEWVRPAPEVQAKIWNDNRYKDFAKDSYPWLRDFLLIDDPESASVTDTLSNLSGFWTAKSSWVEPCRVTPEGKELERWDESAPPRLSNTATSCPAGR